MASRPARLNTTNLLTVGSAAVLIGTEVIAAAFAAGWALGGLFGLGEIGTYILEGVGVVLGILALLGFLRSAMQVEPILE